MVIKNTFSTSMPIPPIIHDQEFEMRQPTVIPIDEKPKMKYNV
jgi:hypothetical protein